MIAPSPIPTAEPVEFVPTFKQRVLLAVLRPRKQWLWHPDSPGMKVLVVRTWVGRLFKPRDFATIHERYLTDTPTLWPPLLADKSRDETD